jgi:two-component system, cell cycle response regulator
LGRARIGMLDFAIRKTTELQLRLPSSEGIALSVLTATRFDELKATNRLPSPSGVALAIMQLTESEKSTPLDIARVLQTDTALSGRVLRLANSSITGRSRAAASVREAVTHLGGRMVRNVALGFSLVSHRSTEVCQAFDYQAFWSNALAMGVAAQVASSQITCISPFAAFTCGLLSQAGRLALATVYPEGYGKILVRSVNCTPDQVRELERAEFATDHNELTEAMMRDWRLPDVCAVAAGRYEHADAPPGPDPDRARSLWQLLRLAAKLANVCVAGNGVLEAQVTELFAAGAEAGITREQMILMCDQVVHEWQEWGKILQVNTQYVRPFAELVEEVRKGKEKLAAPGAANQPVPAPVPPAPAEEKTDDCLSILVAVNDLDELATLSRHLVGAGHIVHVAPDGNAALQRVLETNPHLVIIDWQMPGMTGRALVEALRKTKLGQQLYIILLTTDGQDDAEAEGLDAGADDCLAKPFKMRLLAARLRACTRILQLQNEVRREEEETRRCLAELAVVNRKLQQAALTDSLTGLWNRRFALDRLLADWAESQRTGAPISCMVIDVDHFKPINDAHGHDVGDTVLQAVANVLRGRIRPYDVCCRFGGEEFVVIGAGMDRKTALACAERLRAAVQAEPINAPKGVLKVTISIGVAIKGPTTAAPQSLLKAADEAVYEAKKNGRNQVYARP